jgi:hypothetical protein
MNIARTAIVLAFSPLQPFVFNIVSVAGIGSWSAALQSIGPSKWPGRAGAR